jgi:hypothetical protein
MEGRIGDSALSQLHLIFETCMPWFRKDFAAPDGYSCNWLAVVSPCARHGFRKAHANAPTSASPFAGVFFCNCSVNFLHCVCKGLELLLLAYVEKSVPTSARFNHRARYHPVYL